MNWFQKLPGTRRAASGLEWTLWRKLPLIALAGTMLPLICLGLMHVASDGALQAADARWLQMAGYVVLGTITFDWFMVLTLAIGCFIVMVMKGPGYVADAYELPHTDSPRQDMETVQEASRRRSCRARRQSAGHENHSSPAASDRS